VRILKELAIGLDTGHQFVQSGLTPKQKALAACRGKGFVYDRLLGSVRQGYWFTV